MTATLRPAADTSDEKTSCAVYPVLVGEGYPGRQNYLLENTGPPGRYVTDVFVRAGGQDTSGSFVWTTGVHDDTGLVYVHLHQDTVSKGGQARLDLVLDKYDVDDVPVSATVDVTADDGSRHAFAMAVADQGCPHDRFVSLAPTEPPWRAAVDALGGGPFTYSVSLDVDGTTARTRAPQTGPDAPYEDTGLNLDRLIPGG